MENEYKPGEDCAEGAGPEDTGGVVDVVHGDVTSVLDVLDLEEQDV